MALDERRVVVLSSQRVLVVWRSRRFRPQRQFDESAAVFEVEWSVTYAAMRAFDLTEAGLVIHVDPEAPPGSAAAAAAAALAGSRDRDLQHGQVAGTSAAASDDGFSLASMLFGGTQPSRFIVAADDEDVLHWLRPRLEAACDYATGRAPESDAMYEAYAPPTAGGSGAR